MKKTQFERMQITPINVTLRSDVLTGSVTDHPIKIANDGVEVVSFEKDTNFGTDGTFDLTF